MNGQTFSCSQRRRILQLGKEGSEGKQENHDVSVSLRRGSALCPSHLTDHVRSTGGIEVIYRRSGKESMTEGN